MTKKTSADLIDELGGTRAVARMLGVAVITVNRWKTKGFTPKRLQQMRELFPNVFEHIDYSPPGRGILFQRKSKQAQIAKEAGTSFESVVMEYARRGYCRGATAVALGISAPAMYSICKTYGWTDRFVKRQDCVTIKQMYRERKGVDYPALKAARNKIVYKTVEYKGYRDTLKGHAKRLGIPLGTVRLRTRKRPGDLDYIFYPGIHRPKRRDTSQHPWKSKRD